MEHDEPQFVQFLEAQHEAMAHWLSLIVRSAPVATVAVHGDTQGNLRFLYASSSFRDLYGVEPDQVAENVDLVLSRVHPVDMPRFQACIADSLRWLSPVHCDMRYLHPEKGEIWVEIHATPMRNPDGSVLWYGVDADVTQRKRAEKLLQESDATLREAFDNMVIGCQVLDFDLRFKYLNEQAVRDNRTTREQLLGRRLTDVFPGVEKTPVYATLTHCLRTREVKQLDCEFTYPDGAVGLFELSIQPVPDGILILSWDVTQQRILEAQLQQARRLEAIGRLGSGVAHDFNNLITVIKNYAELLMMHIEEREPMAEWIRGILDACQRSSRLTHQLLTFSRKAAVEPKQLDLNVVIEESLGLLRRLAGGDMKVSIVLDRSIPSILVDHSQLEQVLLNLVLNARDAMPKGGQLTLTTSVVVVDEKHPKGRQLAHGEYVQLSVSDTGKAIPDEIQSQVFEPFFTTKPGGKGTGLGLAVAHGVLRQSGGDIDFVSQPGVGTTFRLLFPAVLSSGERVPKVLPSDSPEVPN